MPKLIITNPDGTTVKYGLYGESFTVGRAEGNDIVLPSGSSSNHHAVLKVSESGDFTVTDLDSTNHTRVNDEIVQSAPLRHGDTIHFGDVVAFYDSDIARVTEVNLTDAGREVHDPAASPVSKVEIDDEPDADVEPEIPSQSLYKSYEYDSLAPQGRSSWPKIIGILGAIFGGTALLAGAVGFLADSFTRKQYDAMGVAPDFFEKHYVFFKVIPPISAFLGLLLLLGSILLIVRKPVSRPLILGWALLKIVFSLWQMTYATALTKDIMPLQMAKMSEAQKNDMAKVNAEAFVDVMFSVMQVLSVLWLSALPIFMIIWFMRKKIRTETASWVEVGPEIAE